MRYVVVIDGEHYPPVTASAVEQLRARGHDVAGAVLAGGKEKLNRGELTDLAGLEVAHGADVRAVLEDALAELAPDAVFDLSDEPVLDYRKRFELAAVALAAGCRYEGADFVLTPPPRPRLARRPTVAFIGTGKRTGKTAVTGFAARHLVEQGKPPVVVAMGRGGPAEPEVLRGDQIELRAEDLLKLADSGGHAASDYVEDALLGRVPAVGCRRCGGGLAGAVGFSNVAEGIRIADDLPGELTLLEGSGAAIPPAHADATVLVVPASIPVEYLRGYLGPYRSLLADLVVFTMCEEPFGSPSQISELAAQVASAYRGHRPEIRWIRTVFRPQPVSSIEGKKVFVATTAPPEAASAIREHLVAEHSAEVTGITHSLSDRDRLTEEIADMADTADTLLCEVKAAAVDVATRRAVEAGLEVVYMDNVPVGVDGDDVGDAVSWVAGLAAERFKEPE